MRSRGFQLVGIALSVIFLGATVLGYFINSIQYSTVIYLISGVLLLQADRVNREPFYFGPGTLFWTGHFLCWIVGGYIFWYLGPVGYLAVSDPIKKLRLSIVVSSLGIGSFASIYYISSLYSKGNYFRVLKTSSIRNVTEALVLGFRWEKVKYLVIIALFLVTIKNFTDTGSHLGYLVSGTFRFSKYIAYALTGFVSFSNKISKRHKALTFALLLIVVSDALVRGGRGPLLLGLSGAALGYTARLIYNKRFPWIRITLFLFVFLFVILTYFRVAGQYRSKSPGNRTLYSGEYGYAVRAEVLINTLSRSNLSSLGFYIDALRTFGNRVYENNASELIYNIRKHRPNVNRLLKDFILQYIPPTIYKKKGAMRNTNLMQARGIVPEGTGSPVTAPIDSYFRFGMLGVLFVYILYAFVLTKISDFLLRANEALPLLLYFVLLVIQIRMYVADSIGLFIFFTSDMVIISVVSIIILYLSGFVRKEQVMQVFK